MPLATFKQGRGATTVLPQKHTLSDEKKVKKTKTENKYNLIKGEVQEVAKLWTLDCKIE